MRVLLGARRQRDDRRRRPRPSRGPDRGGEGRDGAPSPTWSPATSTSCVTHGNGPQVGNLLVKNELAASVVPPVPLDWCGAQTQAHARLRADERARRRAGATGASHRPCATVVTRPGSTPHDPGFASPTKPIGRYLPADEAAAADRARPDLAGPRRPRAGGGSSPRPSRARSSTPPRCTRWSRPGSWWSPTAAAASRWSARTARPARRGGGHRQGPRRRAARPRTVGADVLVIATDVPHAVLALRHARTPSRSAGSTSPSCGRYAARGPLRQRLDGAEGRGGLPVRRAGRAAAPSSPPRPASSTPSPAGRHRRRTPTDGRSRPVETREGG